MANDKNFWDDLDLSGDYGAEEGFSLESILAEYKGNAFLDGDKKTPAEELQRKTDDILREVLGEKAPAASAVPRPEEPEKSDPEPVTDEDIRRLFDSPAFESLNRARDKAPAPAPEEPAPEPEKMSFAPETFAPEPAPEDGERDAALRETPPRRGSDRRAEPAYEEAPEIDLSVFDEPEEPETRREGIEKFINSLGGAGFDTPVEARDDNAGYAGWSAGDFRSRRTLTAGRNPARSAAGAFSEGAPRERTSGPPCPTRGAAMRTTPRRSMTAGTGKKRRKRKRTTTTTT